MNEYRSCSEAGKKNYIYPRCIEKCCRGELLSVGDFLWRRVAPNSPKTNIPPLNRDDFVIPSGPIRIGKYDLDGNLIKEYPSIKAAAKELGIDPKSIRQAVKGRQKTAQGYIWKKL